MIAQKPSRVLLALVAWLGLMAGQAAADWPAGSLEIGARDNPKILARFGGAIDAGPLADYVTRIGQSIVAVSSRPDENWQFTVLDSPEVNAFALPGGYVYVTRGLLALANNEAELAAVLAHEISHVILQHVEQRETLKKDALIDGALGALTQSIFSADSMGEAIRDNLQAALGDIGSHSQEQEFAADADGINLLVSAGYTPHAQADFLVSMAANSALRATMAGRGFDPEETPFFANHPAPALREQLARELAGTMTGALRSDAYLEAIDGLAFGDTRQQGFVQGQIYLHPVLGFTFTASPNLRIQNTPRQINVLGPRGSTLVMTGARDTGGSLTHYLSEWMESIPRRQRTGRRIRNVRNITINGLEATTGTIGLRRNGRRGDLQLTVIRFDGQLIRFAGFSRRRDADARDAMMETLSSFRMLEPQEMAAPRNSRVEIHRVTGRDSVEELAIGFPQSEFATDLFRVLNGMNGEARLVRGALVKIIAEMPE